MFKMVNKQTAVEWLELMVKIGEVIDDDLFKQAKAMEKEQIFNSYEAGFKDEYFEPNEYYNETFKSE